MPFCFHQPLFASLLRMIVIAASVSLAHAADSRNLNIQAGAGPKRVALVIGNGGYQHSDTLPKLGNPTHDAEDIAKALRDFGFEVIERRDQTLEGMNNAIAEFSRKIGNGDAALFYFAGHGLQVKGQNYLIPVDANIETEARVHYVSVNVNQILDEMDNAKSRVNIVMLDACRNNPISGKFRSGATRGLAPVTSQPKGTVIVYATDPGNVAADGDGRNGLFTAGLLTAFKGNDLSLAGVLTRASEEVERVSEQKQTPYINGPATLQKNFQFRQSPQVASLVSTFTPVAVPATARTPEEIEDSRWERIKDDREPVGFEGYLKQYPNGRYSGQAKAALSKLNAEATKLKVQLEEAEARRIADERQRKQVAADEAQRMEGERQQKLEQEKVAKDKLAQEQKRLADLEATRKTEEQANKLAAAQANPERVKLDNAPATGVPISIAMVQQAGAAPEKLMQSGGRDLRFAELRKKLSELGSKGEHDIKAVLLLLYDNGDAEVTKRIVRHAEWLLRNGYRSSAAFSFNANGKLARGYSWSYSDQQAADDRVIDECNKLKISNELNDASNTYPCTVVFRSRQLDFQAIDGLVSKMDGADFDRWRKGIAESILASKW